MIGTSKRNNSATPIPKIESMGGRAFGWSWLVGVWMGGWLGWVSGVGGMGGRGWELSDCYGYSFFRNVLTPRRSLSFR